jgi:hypothetical protein
MRWKVIAVVAVVVAVAAVYSARRPINCTVTTQQMLRGTHDLSDTRMTIDVSCDYGQQVSLTWSR